MAKTAEEILNEHFGEGKAAELYNIRQAMKEYAEQEREKAFKAGVEYGCEVDGGFRGTNYQEYQNNNPLI